MVDLVRFQSRRYSPDERRCDVIILPRRFSAGFLIFLKGVFFMQTNTKNMATAGMLCALAYIVMLVSKIFPEVAGFLQFDLKDVIIVSGGFILGPVYAALITVVVALVEMVTVSNTGPIGLIMNIISTGAFCCVASLVYYKKRTFWGAVSGLALGTLMLTLIMVLWNVYITPLYMKVPRQVVISMLPTVFIPFNLVKGLINSAFTLILYRPLVKSLTRAGLIKKSQSNSNKKFKSSAIVIGISVLVICVPVLLHLMGVI